MLTFDGLIIHGTTLCLYKTEQLQTEEGTSAGDPTQRSRLVGQERIKPVGDFSGSEFVR